ncbi:hypothetical protein EMA8858_01887 [Emticicia aquatica]|jgi:hypothetical protein|uniref:Uncharacterized protein n=1 Tax=Emticicia aquatica TaxID=1681835 RepID=A0ABM9AR64_9BACT|nr:hypothetical protein [Emticicia aquatica]CAH0995760.1 hypothetical protein EMA8858_01887 [Emticicia aquatica]
MTKTAHRIYLGTMTSIVILVTIYLFYRGLPYYKTSIEERFYHVDHKILKPSGPIGHGLGITGTLLMIIGVFGYQARKYMKSLARVWVLKHWLEFHIFLCTLGPIMILFHTSFKFGGLVSISFWSMVAVVASGVVGRFIYLQIPRTIQGRELSLNEIRGMQTELAEKIEIELSSEKLNEILALTKRSSSKKNIIAQYLADWKLKINIKQQLKKTNLERQKLNGVMSLVSNELNMNRKIERLQVMQKWFNYWHVIHLPFAIIMLVIMLIHVGVTIAFGYKWIF